MQDTVEETLPEEEPKSRWPLIVKLSVSGALVGYLLSKADLAEIGRTMAGLSPSFGLAALGLMLIQLMGLTLRWGIITRALQAPVTFGTGLRLVFIGMFFNQTLPSSIGGDAVRIWEGHRSAGLPMGAAFNGVLLDRFVALGVLLLIVALTLPQLMGIIHSPAVAWSVGLMLAAALVGFLVLLNMDRMPKGLLAWKVARVLARLSADGRRVFLCPRVTPRTVLISAAIHGMSALVIYVLAHGLGIPLALWHCLVLVPPIILITTLPISMAGWGVREGAMVVALGYVGVSSQDALTISVLFGLAAVLAGLPGGVLWAIQHHRR